jgi:voltage-gated potassium channel
MEGVVWRQLPNGRVVHRLEPVVLGLALLVVPVVLIEAADAGESWKLGAAVANWLIWVGFTVELLFVAVVAPRKRAALRAHWLDVFIVVVTVPFAPALLASLRLARLVRLVRLVRIAALGARALQAERVMTSRQGFRYAALTTAFLVVVAGVTMSAADAKEFPNPWLGLWWAVTTITTVGYGDVVPHTTVGRILATVLMIAGIGFLSLLTATIASTFVAADTAAPAEPAEELRATLKRIEEKLDRLEATIGQ